jgi:hypothetical protein
MVSEEETRGIAMTTFDDRENAYENKFAHDQELNFKAEARCNKLLAVWAAEKLGKTEAETDAYVAEVIKSDFEEVGHDDVIRKVAGDLGGASSEDEVRAKRSELIEVAREQVVSEA